MQFVHADRRLVVPRVHEGLWSNLKRFWGYDRRAMENKLTIIGLGGSMAKVARSRAALVSALEGATSAGAETALLDIRELDLPMYKLDDAGSGGYLYYATLLLVIPWAYTALRLRFRYATAAVGAIMVGYEVVAIWLKPTPVDILINNNFFFIPPSLSGWSPGTCSSAASAPTSSSVASSRPSEPNWPSTMCTSTPHCRLPWRRCVERPTSSSRLAENDVDAAKALLDELHEQLQETMRELRSLAHGIYPPLLMDQGLNAALSASAKRSPLPTTVEADSLRRYPPEVEATVYFCCLEALQNASKYAGPGATVTIHVEEDPARLVFEVIDNGVGFDSQGKGLGAGFVNMSDRLGAVGGSLQVDSTPGRGTRVAGFVSLKEETCALGSRAQPQS